MVAEWDIAAPFNQRDKRFHIFGYRLGARTESPFVKAAHNQKLFAEYGKEFCWMTATVDLKWKQTVYPPLEQ